MGAVTTGTTQTPSGGKSTVSWSGHRRTSPQDGAEVSEYVSLQLRVQNRRRKWNFPLNFRTMRKLSERYSGIFQTQSSGCASGVDHFRNFTKLKILNI